VLTPSATADQFYHSQHIVLEPAPASNAPLQSGFVENVHANGPTIYAHEIYVLNGAVRNANLEVRLLAYPNDPTCSGSPMDFGSVPLETNLAGNGEADRFFAPGDVPVALRDATHGIIWEVTSNGTVLYETGCSAVTLD
jgi:hypothetical protein